MDYFCFFRIFSNSSNFLSLFPLFSAVVFIALQTFLKCLINAGCHLGFHTTAVWEVPGRTLEHEGAGMSLRWGPSERRWQRRCPVSAAALADAGGRGSRAPHCLRAHRPAALRAPCSGAM
ncbi:unnamed protein product [Rangifer tarandus platyrhynchus]|uniref:Uncharacterized protein n=2 Tax=Rangifer tarandus platyrhynchus TaxID=3082113 RepID=A0AC60A514_RANTA|nr:unnamed protein product [Rangifer tarandus platyrhynchus]